MKRYFLGMAGNYTTRQVWAHTFAVGRESDHQALRDYLSTKYEGEAILCKNGRSALTLALKAYFEPGDGIIVNGFTCYAVYEAVKSAGLVPIFADISREDLNFDDDSLKDIFRTGPDLAVSPTSSKDSVGVPPARPPVRVNIRGIIIQNSLGNTVDIDAVQKFAKKHNLVIIEDLAHCAGRKYDNGQECGTVGVATAFSFGKEKTIDTISGGAVVLRESHENDIKAPSLSPKPSDHLRARFYPLFGLTCRKLTVVHLGGTMMRGLIKIHWVEKSADNRLDLERKPSKFESKLALRQFKKFKKSGESPIREFRLVKDRDELLKKLAGAGYYFGGLWYEKPVSPERYYKRVKFPEKDCPNATFVAEHIINIPTHYGKKDMEPAYKIIKEYIIGGKGGENEQQ